MHAVIIPNSTQTSLSPLLCNRRINELPIMGFSVEQHIRMHLSKHNIISITSMRDFSFESLLKLSDKDGILSIENNLITAVDISDVISTHHRTQSDITMVLRPLKDSASRSINSVSPISITGSHSSKVNIKESELEGIYIYSKSVLEALAEVPHNLDEYDIFSYASDNGFKTTGYLVPHHSVTISGVCDYRQCHKDILDGTLPNYLPGTQIRDGFFMENDVCLESGVKIETPVYISRGCHIEKDAKIGGGTFIGKDCSIKSGVTICQSIIGASCTLSDGTSVNGGILDNNINLGKNVDVMDSAIIGSGCRVEKDCVINSGVRVWPNKRILHGTRLNNNLIWGSVGTEKLFSDGKIRGEINVDITPEFMAKLGAALGTMYRGCKIGLSYDSAPVCQTFASATLSGLVSTGAKIYNFGEQSLPSSRLGTRFFNTAMTLHISQSSADGGFCPELDFIESDGSPFSDINQHNLESVFLNNVYLRTDIKKLQDYLDLSQYRLIYVQEILNGLKSTRFDKNMEIRTHSETLSDILEILLGEVESITHYDSPVEFSADLDFSGQEISLHTKNGKKIDKTALMYITSVMLVHYFGCKTIVLPIYAPSALEEMLFREKVNIIKCGTSSSEFITTLLKNNLNEQFRLCFDGIFCAITLLDFLNYQDASLDMLIKEMPEQSSLETEVECPNSRKANIIDTLCEKYHNNKIEVTDGIKIYQNNGWVLIIPEKHRHYVKIITEGINMEAAAEISAEFTNQIKKLANLQ